jgi:hypothetical protein
MKDNSSVFISVGGWMVMPLSEMGRNGESQGDLRNLIW